MMLKGNLFVLERINLDDGFSNLCLFEKWGATLHGVILAMQVVDC
jgi:hypothetical protein